MPKATSCALASPSRPRVTGSTTADRFQTTDAKGPRATARGLFRCARARKNESRPVANSTTTRRLAFRAAIPIVAGADEHDALIIFCDHRYPSPVYTLPHRRALPVARVAHPADLLLGCIGV